MAITVEDGTGLEAANAYVSVETADAYLANEATWLALTEAQKEAAITDATVYADNRWGQQLTGSVCVSTQALQFPRDNYTRKGFDYFYDGVPTMWLNGVMEYALETLSGSLNKADKGDAQALKLKEVGAGPAKVKKEYFSPNGSNAIYNNYPKADSFCKQFIHSANKVFR